MAKLVLARSQELDEVRPPGHLAKHNLSLHNMKFCNVM